ncbi:MAG: hypothetical protein IPF54_22135 [Draconibacterium sp.]|nr:hypothetical protein [Draconibacterium sp.]
MIIIVPEVINMLSYNARFSVKDNNRRTLIDKKSQDGVITIIGQTITIPLLIADTKGKAGKHSWELEISNTNEVFTIGRGIFIIISELIF